MIVYCNTTPFIALAGIKRLDLLPKLFGTVHVAQAVIDSFRDAAMSMQQNGVYYNPSLILRIARHLGEEGKEGLL